MGARIYSFVQFKMLFLLPFLIPFFIWFCLSFYSSPFVPSSNSRIHDPEDTICYFSRRALWSLWRKLGPPVYFYTHIPTHICGALHFWARLCFTLYSKMKLNHYPLNWTVASSPAPNSTFAVSVSLLEIPLSTPVRTLLTAWRSTLRSRMPLWLAQSLARKKNPVGLTAEKFLKTEGGELVQWAAVPYETSGETRLRGWPKFMAKLWLTAGVCATRIITFKKRICTP